jgi:hypothetical protein
MMAGYHYWYLYQHCHTSVLSQNGQEQSYLSGCISGCCLVLHDDEETVCAERKATKMDFIEAEMMDLHLWYEIPYMTSNNT